MLHTISLMVIRIHSPRERERLWPRILTGFLVGGLAGGAVMGALIAVVARFLFYLVGAHPAFVAGASAAVAAAYAGRAASVWRFPKPQSPHQVPPAWRDIFGPIVASVVYAAGLGAIYFTRIGSLAAYPLAILLLGMGAAPIAIIEIMAVVGLVRAATALVGPFLHLDRGSSQTVPALMERRAIAVRRTELFVLAGLVFFPAAMLLA
jgi:hypothetical protein